MNLDQRDKRIEEIRLAKIALPKDEEGKWLDSYCDLVREEKELWRDFPDPPPSEPFVVAKINSGGGSCPTQFFGETPDGKEVYARYRHGYLSVDIDDKQIFGKQLDWGNPENHTMEYYLEMWKGDQEKAKSSFKSHELTLKFSGGYCSYAGTLSYEELKEATEGWFIWPEIDW